MGANQQQNRDLSWIGIYTDIIRDIDIDLVACGYFLYQFGMMVQTDTYSFRKKLNQHDVARRIQQPGFKRETSTNMNELFQLHCYTLISLIHHFCFFLS